MVRGLAIGGFGDPGIWLEQPGGNEVYGNYVGFDATGTVSHGQRHGGIGIGSPNTTSSAAWRRSTATCIPARLVLAVFLTASNGNRIEGNYIGTGCHGQRRRPQMSAC